VPGGFYEIEHVAFAVRHLIEEPRVAIVSVTEPYPSLEAATAAREQHWSHLRLDAIDHGSPRWPIRDFPER
jgi:hypothetical protein